MIRVEGLHKSYLSDGKRELAVRGISFEHKEGEFLTLLGPSGCGKTTILRCIAGLETPDEGEIRIGDKVVFSSEKGINLSPARRKLGMVFQSYAIWPHMTVSDNVAYPLRFERMSKDQRRESVGRVLEAVGLGALAQRAAPDLSGGQQQRVALARALVAEPEVLLLDEPLSNLDASLRRGLGNHIRDLQRRLGLTVIYVTHDQAEAMSMSDRIALMDHGLIVERGQPEAIYHSPRSEFAAQFVGDASLLEVKEVTRSATGWEAETTSGRLLVSPPDGTDLDGSDEAGSGGDSTGGLPGEAYSILIRPESLAVTDSAEPPGDWNVFEGAVEAARYFGFFWELEIRLAAGHQLLKVKSLGKKHYEMGAPISVRAHRDSCLLVRRSATHYTPSDPAAEEVSTLADEERLSGAFPQPPTHPGGRASRRRTRARRR
jgi:iron(III) transport system ATP-binding protein